MATIDSRQFNWLPRTSAWQSVQNWREKNRAFQAQADATFASSAEIFGAATTNLGIGLAEIAARQAAARVSATLQAKIASSVDVSA